MTDLPRPSNEPGSDDARDEAIGRLINEFFDRRESGEIFTEEEFLAQNADFADELREHLTGLDLIKGIGSSSAADGLESNRTQSIARDRHEAAAELEDIHIPEIPGYRIQRPLGRGGMGIVYKAIQNSTGRQVALKVLLEGPFAAPQARKRFEREISLSAQLRHPNIIPIYDSGRADGRMYYAMEYVRGLPLTEYVLRENPGLTRRLQLFCKIGAALRHAHQRGVVHRDLKPSNVLVNADGEPHLLDFGLAKQGTFSDMTTSLTAQIIGTPAYMSPEQAAGDPSGIDVRTDVYSLGVVLYELVSGELPYDTKVSIGKLLTNIAKCDPDETHLSKARIDPELTAIVLKALEKNKDDRYQSVDAFLSDVTHYMADEPISVRPASGAYFLRKTFWRHRVAIAAVGIAAVLFGGVGYMLYKINSALNENQVKIARQDEAIKVQAEEKRLLAEQIEKKKTEVDAYEALIRQFGLDPKVFQNLSKIAGEGRPAPAIGELMQLLANASESNIPTNTGSAPARPAGKDLEAGYQEFAIGEISPNSLTPADSVTPEARNALTIAISNYIDQLKAAEQGRQAASQPSSQPADSVADAIDGEDGKDAVESGGASVAPKAVNKS
ncbi:MAG: serine/threonine protein kinase [Phycisphaerales bacterium]|nr:serine/threonine protein kinase [Phycisphaerales bacterium]